GLPTVKYKDYLERSAHAAFDEYLRDHLWRWSPEHGESFLPEDFHEKFEPTEGYDPKFGTPLAWDPDLRLKEYDRLGVACEVLFPDDQSTNDPPFGSGLAGAVVDGSVNAPEFVRAGARAYNRWMADFCSTDPERLRGLIALGTLDDVTWCVNEI